jgi:hypothetical protein
MKSLHLARRFMPAAILGILWAGWPVRGEEPPQESPEAKAARLLAELAPPPLNAALDGKILDEATGKPLPARVRIRAPKGYIAAAHLPDLGFWCDGNFSVHVPAGALEIEISAGRFRTVFSRTISVAENGRGQIEARLAELTRLLSADSEWRLADLNLALQAQPFERTAWQGPEVTPALAALIARAEGLRILGLAGPWREGPNGFAPEAAQELEKASGPELLLLPTFPGPSSLFSGCALGVGLSDWRGLPRYLMSPRESLRDYLEETRKRGALAVFGSPLGSGRLDLKAPGSPRFKSLRETGFLLPEDAGLQQFAGGELPYATLTGPAYDALAFDGSETAEALWFNLLNEGFRLSIIAARGGSLKAGRAPFGDTLLRVPGAPTATKVVEALRRGEAIVTFGPLLMVQVPERDRLPGAGLPADGARLHLLISGSVSSAPSARLTAVEIVRNGQVVHTEKLTLTGLSSLKFPLAERQDAWYVVRMSESSGQDGKTVRRAWSNPIYFETAARRAPPQARTRLRGTLRQLTGEPLAGAVTVVLTEKDGRFDFVFASGGTLIFGAPGFEPREWKAFAHPRVQRELAALITEREAPLEKNLAKRSLLGLWMLRLAELEQDIKLEPLPKPAPPPPGTTEVEGKE